MLLILCTELLTVLIPIDNSHCDEGWSYVGGECFRVFNVKMEFDDAENYCKDHFARLAEPLDFESFRKWLKVVRKFYGV